MSSSCSLGSPSIPQTGRVNLLISSASKVSVNKTWDQCPPSLTRIPTKHFRIFGGLLCLYQECNDVYGEAVSHAHIYGHNALIMSQQLCPSWDSADLGVSLLFWGLWGPFLSLSFSFWSISKRPGSMNRVYTHNGNCLYNSIQSIPAEPRTQGI